MVSIEAPFQDIADEPSESEVFYDADIFVDEPSSSSHYEQEVTAATKLRHLLLLQRPHYFNHTHRPALFGGMRERQAPIAVEGNEVQGNSNVRIDNNDRFSSSTIPADEVSKTSPSFLLRLPKRNRLHMFPSVEMSSFVSATS